MDIAIIGGGAAAVGLLDALAAAEDSGPGTITVFEPSPRLWRGRPYGPDLDAVLVNAPPAIMSIRHGDLGHYAAWLGERGAAHLDPLLGQPLVPRALYGDYLAYTAEKATAALEESGLRVRVEAARVAEATRSGGRLTLRTGDGRAYAATHLALCVGSGAPPDPYGLTGSPGYTGDPYPLARTLDGVCATDDVAIIGSGLTAVDVVVSLAARGHTGRIALLSRSGLLPHVWQRPVDRRPRHLTAERITALYEQRAGSLTLEDLVGLLRAELADAKEDFGEFAAELMAADAEDPARRLRRQLAAVDDPRIGRRMLQEAAHAVGPYAWRLLPDADRARLRQHFRLAVGVASPMVPVNAAVLLRLLESGQLVIAPGVRAIERVNGRANGRFQVHAVRGAGRTADVVVNAVNPAPQSVPDAARHLVQSLGRAGLATPHPGGGLVPADPRLHVVGDLAGGGSFITTSIPGVAAQARRAARALRAS
ncbi:pyridine nucleotide-disulfide oxidoreductase [Streptomyces longisporoflavus]|uniref:FAD/NAD(P)-binding protein n=1 Tax=Streptomyces longisporoflavus TaxID=28044 RepID=UPI00167E6FF2|nr:FAD/NAD(P)-binding protein [Streptomyces longisporoflavus]GGV71269.1 pyridine nucleotide-disulfide oxidoreductase [Streptomyces longisporoflavus]